MNKIVKEHYPVDRLPADLRSGLDKFGWVRVEIEPEVGPPHAEPLVELVGSGQNIHGTPEDVVSHLQSLREDR